MSVLCSYFSQCLMCSRYSVNVNRFIKKMWRHSQSYYALLKSFLCFGPCESTPSLPAGSSLIPLSPSRVGGVSFEQIWLLQSADSYVHSKANFLTALTGALGPRPGIHVPWSF